MRVLVTGASGFVGRAVCAELALRKHNVRRAVRRFSGSDGGYFMLGDIGLSTNWSGATEDMDAVVHLAARVHILRERAGNPLEEFLKVNVAGTEHLARAAAASRVKRFVYVSSIGVNGLKTAPGKAFSELDNPIPHNAYTLSKWKAEQCLLRIAEETGLESVVIRPPLVYGFDAPGNFGSLIRVVQRGWPLPLAGINNRRSLIYVGNLVDAIVTCTAHPKAAGQTYLVSDGEDVSIAELIRRIAHALGRPARLFPFPPSLIRLAGRLIGKSAEVDRLLGSLTVDTSKIRRELDWKPPYTMEQGLKETAEWFKRQG